VSLSLAAYGAPLKTVYGTFQPMCLFTNRQIILYAIGKTRKQRFAISISSRLAQRREQPFGYLQ
jgi:hypothetical protein